MFNLIARHAPTGKTAAVLFEPAVLQAQRRIVAIKDPHIIHEELLRPNARAVGLLASQETAANGEVEDDLHRRRLLAEKAIDGHAAGSTVRPGVVRGVPVDVVDEVADLGRVPLDGVGVKRVVVVLRLTEASSRPPRQSHNDSGRLGGNETRCWCHSAHCLYFRGCRFHPGWAMNTGSRRATARVQARSLLVPGRSARISNRPCCWA